MLSSGGGVDAVLTIVLEKVLVLPQHSAGGGVDAILTIVLEKVLMLSSP